MQVKLIFTINLLKEPLPRCAGTGIYPIAPLRSPVKRLCGGLMMKAKVLLGLLALLGLLSTSGCVIREGRGRDWDDHWHGYGHEHWEHHDWH